MASYTWEQELKINFRAAIFQQFAVRNAWRVTVIGKTIIRINHTGPYRIVYCMSIVTPFQN